MLITNQYGDRTIPLKEDGKNTESILITNDAIRASSVPNFMIISRLKAAGAPVDWYRDGPRKYSHLDVSDIKKNQIDKKGEIVKTECSKGFIFTWEVDCDQS